MGEFVKVARVADIPSGQGRRVEVAGRSVALFNCAGTFYAVDDTCTHAQASLSEGFLEGATIECPLHGGRFDLRTGAAVWSPAFRPVATYAVRVEATTSSSIRRRAAPRRSPAAAPGHGEGRPTADSLGPPYWGRYSLVTSASQGGRALSAPVSSISS